ncbi:hypothetical protein BDN72DRAFT_905277, partial [Pluteus cervinus]
REVQGGREAMSLLPLSNSGAELFSRAAFEPADEDLLGEPMDVDSDEEYAARKSKGKGRASSKRIQWPQRKRKPVVLDSDEEDEEVKELISLSDGDNDAACIEVQRDWLTISHHAHLRTHH